MARLSGRTHAWEVATCVRSGTGRASTGSLAAVITIDELLIADAPEAWAAAGFTVEGDTCRVGAVRLRFVGREHGLGIVGWSLRGTTPEAAAGLAAAEGLPTDPADPKDPEDPADPAEQRSAAPTEHPIGAEIVDHVVVMSPDLARTTAALEALGLDVRRVRDFDLGGTPMRQVFFRLGEVILELVGSPTALGEGPATFWGLTFTVADIDGAAELLGERTGRVKDAVQKGRRITTLRHRDLDLSVATALMSPKPPKPGS